MRFIKNQDGQFMLLASFIIAIGLSIVTVMLNSVIFESNKAIGVGTDPSKMEIINLMSLTRDELRNAYRNSTDGVGNPQKIPFNNQMNNFSKNLPRIYAMRGEGVNVSWEDWAGYAYFTENGAAGGASNWTVIENVKDSIIRINTSGNVQIGLINTSIRWINSSGSFSFNNATSGDPYSIVFRNGDAASGSFNITGRTNNSRNFTRARDYNLNATIILSTSRVRANVTIPVSVPW